MVSYDDVIENLADSIDILSEYNLVVTVLDTEDRRRLLRLTTVIHLLAESIDKKLYTLDLLNDELEKRKLREEAKRKEEVKIRPRREEEDIPW